MTFADVLRRRRLERGLTQAKLAAAVGLNKRQIARYEAGLGEPTLPNAVVMATILDLSLGELAGVDVDLRDDQAVDVDVHGAWRGATQTLIDELMTVIDFGIEIHQTGSTLDLRAEPDDDSPVSTWRGQLHLNGDRTLPGTFHVIEPVTASGTLFFTLDPSGDALTGRWVTATTEHRIASGWTALSRNGGPSPRRLLDELLHATTSA